MNEKENKKNIQNEQTEATETTTNQQADTANEQEATAQSEPTDTEKLEKAEEEIAQLKDKYLRQVAEFDNYRKRTLKEKAELLLNGSEKAVCAFLPILDDFERAIADKTEDVNAIKEGVQIIFNKFNKTLESLGVRKIDQSLRQTVFL